MYGWWGYWLRGYVLGFLIDWLGIPMTEVFKQKGLYVPKRTLKNS
jgi:hypothetical protein